MTTSTFIVWEGECYCIDCANTFAMEEQDDPDLTDDDKIFSCPEDAGISPAINWENPDLYCSSMHGCGQRIESAYAEDRVDLIVYWRAEAYSKIEHEESTFYDEAVQDLAEQFGCTDENVSFFERFDADYPDQMDLAEFTRLSIEILGSHND